MTQAEFNKFLSNAINSAPVAGSSDLTARTNPQFLMFSAVAGAGLQLKKVTMDTILAYAVNTDLGYKVVELDLTQTGTSAPVVTEVLDDAGKTYTGAYSAKGNYTVTASSAIFVAGTSVDIAQNVPGAVITAVVTSTSVITITTKVEDGVTSVLSGENAVLAATRLTIKIPV